MSAADHTPTVSVVIPVLNEEQFIRSCLDAVARQSYPDIVEILVVDGGSSDRTCQIASEMPLVRILHNPSRIQAAGLNIALREVVGDITVRVDGHCEIDADYVTCCVAALSDSRAAMVGGAMTPRAEGGFAAGIAAAMSSRLGAGPAAFHVGGVSRWTDTVYLGAFRTDLARATGGYAEDVGVNEDAEFAIRMAPNGGIWFDERIHSSYVPRSSLAPLGRQFFRYGRSRASTVRRHPRSLRPRQLAAPGLLIALVLPCRRYVAAAYVGVVASRVATEATRAPGSALGMALAMPTMHAAWGSGFIVGLLRGAPRVPATWSPRSALDESA